MLRSSVATLILLAGLLVGSLLVSASVQRPLTRVVIHFQPDSTQAEREAWLAQHETLLQIPALDAAALRTILTPEALQADPLVAFAEYDAPIALLQENSYPAGVISHPISPAPPPDPRYAEQWNLQAVGAPDAWMLRPDSHDVTVALIDSGICQHAEFVGLRIRGYDFVEGDHSPQDEHGHGCGVAGILAATRQNAIGIAGLLKDPRLLALRVADANGVGYASSVAAALVYAADANTDYINISLGTRTDTRIMRQAVAYAQGIPMIAAAGPDDMPRYPAAYAEVMAVGGSDRAGNPLTRNADRFAPGVDILTTGLNGQIVTMNGSSAAAAHMTGVLALQSESDGEVVLGQSARAQLQRDVVPLSQPPARQITVFVVVYRSSTPLYDPLTLNTQALADMTRSTIWHGYDNPQGQAAIEFVVYGDGPVVVEGPPPAPDPNYANDYNYAAIYDDFDLCTKIQNHEVDEVWIWGEANPQFGKGLEWVTNGPQLQWTWSSNVPDCGRTITTMWYEYNREVALALHSFGHRMEGAFMVRLPCQFMTHSAPWAGRDWLDERGQAGACVDSLSDSLGFVARPFEGNNHVGVCGDVHAPPNVLPNVGPYQYTQTNTVETMCEDWHRDGTGTTVTLNCERWNCNERDYQIYWKQNIPSIGHNTRDSDGSRMPNWYDYLYDM